MTISEQKQELLNAYLALQQTIQTRQAFERSHPTPPYSVNPTTYDYHDFNGNTLLFYATKLGDLEKIKECLANGATVEAKTRGGGYASQTALKVALKSGNLEIAQFLYTKDKRDLSDVVSYRLVADNCKQWYLDTEKKRWLNKFEGLASISLGDFKQKYSLKQERELADAYHLALLSGDVAFFDALRSRDNKNIFTQYFNGIYKSKNDAKVESFLISAASAGSLPLIIKLRQEGACINTPAFTTSPLHEAVSEKHIAVIDYLLTNQADVNAQDQHKKSPLFYAIINNDLETIKKLIANGAKLDLHDINGENILHYVIKANSPDLLKYFFSIKGIKDLLQDKNAYGFTPVDFAYIYERAKMIEISPEDFQTTTLTEEECRNAKIDIRQSAYLDKIASYIDEHYGNKKITAGMCAGIGTLFEHETREAFLDMQRLLAQWDGKKSRILDQTAQKYGYLNFDDFLKYRVNDLIWLQHEVNDVDQFAQRDIRSHYKLAGDEHNLPYYCYGPDDDNGADKSPAQLKEFLSFLERMPECTRLALMGAKHHTSLYRQDGLYYYMDPNMPKAVPGTSDVNKVLENIINYKYILLNKYKPTAIECILGFYYLDRDKETFKQYHYFQPREFPKNQTAARAFQQKSPNGFTPLHVAVITHSIQDVKTLLQQQVVDPAILDHHDQSALDYAIKAHFNAAIDLIIASPGFNLNKALKQGLDYLLNTSKSVVLYPTNAIAYIDFAISLSQKVPNHLQKEVDDFLIEIIKKCDFNERDKIPLLLKLMPTSNEVFKTYLQKMLGKANILNARGPHEQPILFHAIQQNNLSATKALLDAGASPNVYSPYKTPVLNALIKSKFKNRYDFIKLILAYHPDVQLKNAKGETALHLVRDLQDPQLTALFIQNGYNIAPNKRKRAGGMG